MVDHIVGGIVDARVKDVHGSVRESRAKMRWMGGDLVWLKGEGAEMNAGRRDRQQHRGGCTLQRSRKDTADASEGSQVGRQRRKEVGVASGRPVGAWPPGFFDCVRQGTELNERGGVPLKEGEGSPPSVIERPALVPGWS